MLDLRRGDVLGLRRSLGGVDDEAEDVVGELGLQRCNLRLHLALALSLGKKNDSAHGDTQKATIKQLNFS